MVSWEDAAVTSVQQCLKWNQADIVFLLITIAETRADRHGRTADSG